MLGHSLATAADTEKQGLQGDGGLTSGTRQMARPSFCVLELNLYNEMSRQEHTQGLNLRAHLWPPLLKDSDKEFGWQEKSAV